MNEEKFKVGNILEDVMTKERFKVIEINGDGSCAYITLLHLDLGLRFGNFANNLTELVLIKQIKFEYQVKKPIHLFDSDTRDRYEVKVLMHPCDPNKSDRENLDDAFIKACELGADPNKNVRWKFIDGDWDGTSKCYSKKPNGGNRRCAFFVDGKCCFKGKENPFECEMSL